MKITLAPVRSLLGPAVAVLERLRGDRRLYLVGGTVRDLLLERVPLDLDFAVSGDAVAFARRLARALGAAYVPLRPEEGEVRVVLGSGLVLDFLGLGASPIEDDLARRDFTINSMAVLWDPVAEDATLIDPAGGRAHLAARRIELTAEDALAADPLRVLRAQRLALELGFEVAPGLWLRAAQVSLAAVAAERITFELARILECSGASGELRRLQDLGLLVQILPEARALLADRALAKHSFATCDKLDSLLHAPSFFSDFADVVEYLARPRQRLLLMLGGLLHDLAKPETQFETATGEVHFYGHDGIGARRVEKLALNRLRLTRKEARVLRTIVARHMHLHLLATASELTDRAIRRFFRLVGDEAPGVMLVSYADGFATAGRTGHLEETIRRMLALLRADREQVRVVRLVTGDDLIAWGLQPGPVFRPILNEFEALQLEGKIKTKEDGRELLPAVLARLAHLSR